MSSRDDRPASGTEPSTSRPVSPRRAEARRRRGGTADSAVQARAPKRADRWGRHRGTVLHTAPTNAATTSSCSRARRTGRHVLAARDGLDDGLYADGGAEQLPPQPGAERSSGYVQRVQPVVRILPASRADARGGWTGQNVPRPGNARGSEGARAFGLNQREIEFTRRITPFLEWRPVPTRAVLPDRCQDEYWSPSASGLDALDVDQHDRTVPPRRRRRARSETHRLVEGSALQSVWHAAILNLRGVAFPC